MRIEDAKKGMKVEQNCLKCPHAQACSGPMKRGIIEDILPDPKDDRPIIFLGEFYLNGGRWVEGKMRLNCPASQFTSREPQDWSLEALQAVKTKEEAKRWMGKRVSASFVHGFRDCRLVGWDRHSWLTYEKSSEGHSGSHYPCDVGAPTGDKKGHWLVGSHEIGSVLSDQDWSLEALRSVKTTKEAQRWIGAKVKMGDGKERVITDYVGTSLLREWRTGAVASRPCRPFDKKLDGRPNLLEFQIVEVLSPPPGSEEPIKEEPKPSEPTKIALSAPVKKVLFRSFQPISTQVTCIMCGKTYEATEEIFHPCWRR